MSFSIDAFQNRHIPTQHGRVDAILSITSGGEVRATGGNKLLVGFIVDTSGSMSGDRISSVKSAVARAIGLMDPSSSFFVVAFASSASVVFPPSPATPANHKAAEAALLQLMASGGTAMSRGLATARRLFEKYPDTICQAVFLTDGKNESEKPARVAAELAQCSGRFQCDCWGVGTDWQVGEVQQIAKMLLGKASLIPDASGIDGAFQAAMQKAASKSLKDVRLRLWTPLGAQTLQVKQVNPTIEDMTGKFKELSPQVREYMTGAWGAGESRDFHVAIEVKPGHEGDEMLAARPSILYLESDGSDGWVEKEVKPPEARLFATWTGDASLSSRIDPHVAHYSGQDELANAIQHGLELRERGDAAAATHELGRAVRLAYTSGNSEMTRRLSKVVDVLDAANGTVRLKRDVAKAAAMELQLESHTTKRSKRVDPGPPRTGS